MLYLLSVALRALDASLKHLSACAWIDRNIDKDDQLVEVPETGIVLPERDAQALNPELVRKLQHGRKAYAAFRQIGAL
jgi:hypothetical protein